MSTHRPVSLQGYIPALKHICIPPRVPGRCLTMPSWIHAGKTAVPLRYLECMCPCGHGNTWPAKGQHASMGSYVAMHM